MKYSVLVIATFLIIEISLSDAAVKPKDGGTYERKASNNKVVSGNQAAKRKPSKSVWDKEREDEENEEIELLDDEMEEVSPKKPVPVRRKSNPKQKSTLERAPTPKRVARRKVAQNEEAEDESDGEREIEGYENSPSSNRSPKETSPSNSMESAAVLQEMKLQMKNLSSIVENLTTFLRNNWPKALNTVSNFGSPVTDTLGNVASDVTSALNKAGQGNLAGVVTSALSKADQVLSGIDTSLSSGTNIGKFEERLKAYLQNIVKYSKTGNAKLSIPPLDPYRLSKKVDLKLPNEAFKMELANVKIFGFSDAKFSQLESDFANGVFHIHFTIPVVKCQGQYSANGILALDTSHYINTQGGFEISFTELRHILEIQGEVRDGGDGNKYFQVKSATVQLNPESMDSRFDNLFGNNRNMNDYFNKLMNENWYEVFHIIQPRLQEEMNNYAFRRLMISFFRATPFNEMFSDN